MNRRSSAIVLLGAVISVASFASPAFAVGEPSVVRAATIDDGDGYLDAISVTFSTPMETTSPSSSWFSQTAGGPGFWVDGYAIVGGSWIDSTTLRLTLAPQSTFDTGARPAVFYNPVAGGPRSAGTNLAASATSSEGVRPSDGAGPVLASAVARDIAPVNLFNGAGDELALGFSEPVLLAGVGTTRSSNLENVIKFSSVTADGANGCPFDGTALQNQNFPQQGTGESPVLGDPTTPATAIVVKQQAGNTGSVRAFSGVPRGCALSIDANNTAVIRDGSGNAVRAFNAAAGKTVVARITPKPIALKSVVTTDGVGSTPDGVPDGLSFTFSDPISDATIDQLASRTTVTLNGEPLTDGAADTGAAPNDSIVRLSLTLPAEADATAIQVAYAAASCSHTAAGTTTNGLSGPIPYGWNYQACVSGFAASATDGVGPAVLQAVTGDSDTDGRIDHVAVTFSEAVASGAPDGWKLGTLFASSFTPGDDATTATLSFGEGNVADGGATPALSYSHAADAPTLDGSDNEVPNASWPTSDGVGPGIVSAVATDTDDNGHVDRVTATLSENATIAADATPTATFGSTEATQVRVEGNELIARFSGATGSGTASFTAGSGITDLGGTPMPNLAFSNVSEAIAPRGIISVSPSAPIKAGDATVRVDYTEAMADEALAVTLGSLTIAPVADDQHTANGWRIDDPSVWEGATTIAPDACSESAGCAVTLTATGGHDLAGLAPTAAPSLETFIDTVAPDAAPVAEVVGAGTTGAPANVVNSYASNISVTVDVPNGQADGGTVSILLDGAAPAEAITATVPAGADTVTVTTEFDSPAELQAALGADGEHTAAARLCDAAMNCTDGTAVSFTLDTTIASPLVTEPANARTVRGGSQQPIDWNAVSEEAVVVDLAYSTNGTSWTAIASDQPASGSYAWSTPALNAREVQVRATARDAAGNLAPVAADGLLTIDSKAPAVSKFRLMASRLVRGKRIGVRWTARDLTFDSTPIVLQESLNGGRNWRNVNGGRYSKANDGYESVKLPAKRLRSYRVRIVASDSVGYRTIRATRKLIVR